MTARRPAIFTVLFCTIAFAHAAAGQTTANPLYEAWARTKLGSIVVHTGNSKTMGLDTTIETTTKLLSIAPDRVTLEVAKTVTMAGKEPEATKSVYEIRSTLPEGEKMTLIAPSNEVFVGGKSYVCKVYESVTQAGELKTGTQTWFCDTVPGGVVRINSRTDGPISMTTTIDLKEVK